MNYDKTDGCRLNIANIDKILTIDEQQCEFDISPSRVRKLRLTYIAHINVSHDQTGGCRLNISDI